MIARAIRLILSGNPDLVEAVLRSLEVTMLALLIGCLIGYPLGTFLGTFRFRGRTTLTVMLDLFITIPPVMIGVVVYLAFSGGSPLFYLGLIYTPTAMIIAQVLILTPIIISMTMKVVGRLADEYADHFQSIGVGPVRRVRALLWDGRFALVIIVLITFVRGIGELGAVLVIGGNIDGLTRTMTTAIVYEVGDGNVNMVIGIGLVLVTMSLFASILVLFFKSTALWKSNA
ncbi:MAG: tungstate transport system permease protein [Paracoccaceae bacterium]|jgi:tungstate transport system permease protein|tara:strand:- start:704 stop:1393 length:690 start_codon:yes stop_codon:yes gene_type:complete